MPIADGGSGVVSKPGVKTISRDAVGSGTVGVGNNVTVGGTSVTVLVAVDLGTVGVGSNVNVGGTSVTVLVAVGGTSVTDGGSGVAAGANGVGVAAQALARNTITGTKNKKCKFENRDTLFILTNLQAGVKPRFASRRTTERAGTVQPARPY